MGPAARRDASWPACPAARVRARSRCLANGEVPKQATFAREARRFGGFERHRNVGQGGGQARAKLLTLAGAGADADATQVCPSLPHQAARVVAERFVEVGRHVHTNWRAREAARAERETPTGEVRQGFGTFETEREQCAQAVAARFGE